MRRSFFALAPLTLLALASVHCGDDDVPATPTPGADSGADTSTSNDDAGAKPGPGADAGTDSGATPEPPDPPLVPASKVDLLFVVDNSSGMGQKHTFLGAGVGKVLAALAAKDIHVGVISTSLGNGGNVCTSANPRTDDHGRLRNVAAGGAVVPGAESGFLTLGATGVADVAALEAKTKEIIGGVGQTGCGFEAQLEAMYRFVVEPEPPTDVTLDDFRQAKLGGIDYDLLKQRKAFFRPDSAVAIVMLTDEDDGSIDPLAIAGFGYAFASTTFPGSNVARGTSAQGKTAPRGTSACATDPLSADCTSCGFAQNCDGNTAACQKLRNDANCKESQDGANTGAGYDGFYGPSKDDLNVRMFDMRRRYGVEPRFPVTRYTVGFSNRRVPSRAEAHIERDGANGQRNIGEYMQSKACTNPLFATGLPEKAGDELCHLADGTRSSKLVYFGLLGGAPSDLVKAPVAFEKLVGTKPAADGSVSNASGLDPRMIESVAVRAGVTGDFDKKEKDLQFACTFDLPTPIECTPDKEACECNPVTDQPPALCGGTNKTTQLRDRAFPTFREYLFAQQLGDRALVGSACDLDAAKSYGAFFDAFAVKVNGGLSK